LKKLWRSYNAWQGVCLCVFVLLTPTTGLSIILHPTGEPNLLTWTDRPVNAVVGRWSSNASFVVVSPKWIITTRHQNSNPATVNINGVTYNCIYNPRWIGGTIGSANGSYDIRLIRLKNLDGSDPNLAYAPPYTDTDEIYKDIVIGGYGQHRGTTLSNGYSWTGSNDTLRWGQNIIEGYQLYPTVETVYADFDLNGRPYEAAPAMYDSGGGWFINQGGIWKLAALTVSVQRLYETWFGDTFWGARISSYAPWINGIINSPADYPVGDLNRDSKVDEFDFAIFTSQWLRTDCVNGTLLSCEGADFQANGKVNFADSAIFAQNWLMD
jgi:hypothetical protein